MPDQVEALVARLLFVGPLLYIGLSMAVEPAGFMTFLGMFARALRTFEQRLRGPGWQRWMFDPEPVDVSASGRNAVRITGMAIIAFAVLVGAGLVE